jgi:hypothetical protein
MGLLLVFVSWFAPTTICFLFVFFSWLMGQSNHRAPSSYSSLSSHMLPSASSSWSSPSSHLLPSPFSSCSSLFHSCFEFWIFLFFFVSLMFWFLGTKLGNYVKHTLKLGIGILRKWIKNPNQNQLLKFKKN